MNSSDPPGAPACVRCAWPSDRTAACLDLTVKPDYSYGHHTPRGRVQVEVGDGVRGRDDTGIRVLTVIITICTVDIDCHGGTDGTTPRQSRGGTRNDCQKYLGAGVTTFVPKKRNTNYVTFRMCIYTKLDRTPLDTLVRSHIC